MKGMTKKILAVMLAASMVFQPGMSAYAAETGNPGQETEQTAEFIEAEPAGKLPDAGEETKEETAVQEQNMPASSEEETGVAEKNESFPAEEEVKEIQEEEQLVESSAGAYMEGSITVASGETVTLTGGYDDVTYEVSGTLNLETGCNLRESTTIYVRSGGTVNVSGGSANLIQVESGTSDARINMTEGAIYTLKIGGSSRNLKVDITGGSVYEIELGSESEDSESEASEINISGVSLTKITYLQGPANQIRVMLSGVTGRWEEDPLQLELWGIHVIKRPNLIKSADTNIRIPDNFFKWEDNGDGNQRMVLRPIMITDGSGMTLRDTLEEGVEAASSEEGLSVVILTPGTYVLPDIPSNITIEDRFGFGGIVFEHKGTGNIASVQNGATFKNVVFDLGYEDCHGFQNNGGITFEGCSFNGKLFSYGNETYRNCTFTSTADDYNMWVYDGGQISYEGCTFNSTAGKFLKACSEGTEQHDLTIDNCKFVNSGSADKAAVDVKETFGSTAQKYNVSISRCTFDGAFPKNSDSDTLVVGANGLYQVDDRLTDGTESGIVVNLDGVQVYPISYKAAVTAGTGTVKYVTLQAAVDAAHKLEGDVTITLLEDTAENVTIHQKEGLNLTVDGGNNNLAGQLYVDGDGRYEGTDTLTIQGVFFKDASDGDYICVPDTQTTGRIYSTGNKNHAHNLTVRNCQFIFEEYDESDSAGSTGAAVRVASDAEACNLVLQNCSMSRGQSFAQLTGVEDLTVTGCTVTGTENGINISGGGGTAVITDNTITTEGYTVRFEDDNASKAALSGNTFSGGEGIVNQSAGDTVVTITDGHYSGPLTKANTGRFVITGGFFTVNPEREYCGRDEEGRQLYPMESGNADYPYTVGTAAAEIDGTLYMTLEEAFAAAADGKTITVLNDCAGNGIVVPQGKFTQGLTVDFDNHTYTVDGTTVGSTGTETNGFQLLKDNKITFKNGSIKSEKAKLLIQNYSDLTLEEMTLTLNNAGYAAAYTLSNNNGNIVIENSTINANPAGRYAFDVCRFSSYPSVHVTVKGDSTINGDIEVSASGSDAKEGFGLMLEAGTFNGNIVLDSSAEAAMAASPEEAVIRKNDIVTLAGPEGYRWKEESQGVSILTPIVYVAEIDGTKYETLKEAVAAVPVDGTETVIRMIANEAIDYRNNGITVDAGKNIVLDLNGFQVVGMADENNGKALITSRGTFTIMDSSEDGSGRLISGASMDWTFDGNESYAGRGLGNTILNFGTLTIKSGWVENISDNLVGLANGSAIQNSSAYGNAILNIAGGTVKAEGAAVIQIGRSQKYENTLNMSGGTVTAGEDGIRYIDMGVQSRPYRVDLNISGGTISAENGHAVTEYNSKTCLAVRFKISGGYFEGNVLFYGSSIEITGGTFDGSVEIQSAGEDTYASISGGFFCDYIYEGWKLPEIITGGYFKNNMTDWDYLVHSGYKKIDNTDEHAANDYIYKVVKIEYVCQIDDAMYETLEEAFAAAKDGDTITLLKDCAGNGIVVPEGKFADGLTVDFDGHTYTVDGETVGSTGTKTNGFQLLKDNTITFTGGTITSEKAKILIQNYSDLTLKGMTLTLNKEGYNEAYTLSNNNGNIVIADTTINANPAGGYAFDVCRYDSYPSVFVTVTEDSGSSIINGNIQVSASNGDAKKGFALMLDAGTFNGDIVLAQSAADAMDVSSEANIVRRKGLDINTPENYSWEELDEEYEVLRTVHEAKNLTTGKRYGTLAAALAEAESGQTVIPLKDIEDEDFILVMNGAVLDLKGHRVTGATLLYVTGTLKDTGDTRGAFSADAYYLGKSVNSEFPIYDEADGTYSLYDLNVITWDPSTWKYGFAFGDTEDTEKAGRKVLEAEDNGLVGAQVCVNWTERSDNETETETGSEKEIRKNIAFSSKTLNKYAAAPSRKAITISFNNLDTVTGTVKATPMFVVYDGRGAVMMTLPGETWTIKD